MTFLDLLRDKEGFERFKSNKFFSERLQTPKPMYVPSSNSNFLSLKPPYYKTFDTIQ